MAGMTVNYFGALHTKATHLRSGAELLTDAPVDNNGKGSQFSPTDLAATSLACCMMTVMGILANEKDIPYREAHAEVTKIMAADPRRICRIEISIAITDEGLSPENKRMLENAAKNCPVAKSLHPDIQQDVQFSYRVKG